MTAPETIKAFFEAWKARNYSAMFALCNETWKDNHQLPAGKHFIENNFRPFLLDEYEIGEGETVREFKGVEDIANYFPQNKVGRDIAEKYIKKLGATEGVVMMSFDVDFQFRLRSSDKKMSATEKIVLCFTRAKIGFDPTGTPGVEVSSFRNIWQSIAKNPAKKGE
jgi:hypothetical protein